jgi:NitT/TauT family transport system substrate-binding protein
MRTGRTSVLRLTAAVLALLALPGSGLAAEKTRVRLGYLPITDHLTVIAAAHPAFAKVAPDPVKFGSWPELAEAVKAGAVDGAFLLAPIALTLRQQGVPIKLVMLGHRNGSVLTVAKEIGSVADLKGKVIAIPSRFSTHNLLLRRLLAKAGLDADKDVQLVEVPPPEMVQALATKRVSAFIVAEPFGAQAELKGVGKVLLLSKDVWPNHICCVLVLREDLIKAHPAAVQELVNEIANAGRLAAAHPEQAAELSKRFLGQDPAVVLQALTKPRGRVNYVDLVPTIGDLAETQDELAHAKLPVQVDLAAFLDDHFARAAFNR